MKNERISSVRKKVEEGDLVSAFDELKSITKDIFLLNAVSVLESQYNRLENSVMLGLITSEERTAEFNKINLSVLELLHNIDIGKEIVDGEINENNSPSEVKENSILYEILELRKNLATRDEFELFLAISAVINKTELDFFQSLHPRPNGRIKTLSKLNLEKGKLVSWVSVGQKKLITSKKSLQEHSEQILDDLKYDYQNYSQLINRTEKIGLIFKSDEPILNRKSKAIFTLIIYLIFILIYVIEGISKSGTFLQKHVSKMNSCVKDNLVDYLIGARPSYLTDSIFDDYTKANRNLEEEFSTFGIKVENIEHVESYKEYDEVSFDYRNVFRFSTTYTSEVSDRLLF